MDAMDALMGRVSAAALTEPAPDDVTLDRILRAGMRAPDHGRMRPWRFVLVKGGARERLGDLFAEALRRRDPNAAEPMLQAERGKALRAPLIVVVAATVKDNPKVPPVEQIVAVGAAAQNVLLAAHALGFGAMWRTGANAYDPDLKRALGLSPEDALVGFIYLGTPAKMPAIRDLGDISPFLSEWKPAS